MPIIPKKQPNSLPGRICRRPLSPAFTLIEVLVALFILAVGVLGIAGLQFQGLRYNQNAHLRSQAAFLAHDIIERIRVYAALGAAQLQAVNTNTPQQGQASYAIGASVSINAISNNNNQCPENANANTIAITPANDLACWQAQLQTVLPPGSTAGITFTPGGGGLSTYTVTVSWPDRMVGNNTVTYSFQL